MPLGSLFNFFGNLLTGGMQASATQQAGAQQTQLSREALAEQRRQFEESMKWMRESAGLAQEGQELENIRRSQEAQRRAARLEDVAAMFQDVEGMAGLRDVAGRMAPGGEADLRKAAMRELERGSGQLGAMLASQGLTSSGYGAQQQRALAGDVTMGLAQQIAQNRMQQLMGQAGIFGQLTSADLARLGSIADIYRDEAFGADLPYNPGELRDLYREMMGTGGGTVTSPAIPGGTVSGASGGGLPEGMTEQQFEQALGEMWNQPDETGTVPSQTFGSFGEWIDYLKGTPDRFRESVSSWWDKLKTGLGINKPVVDDMRYRVDDLPQIPANMFAAPTPSPALSDFSVRTPMVSTMPVTTMPATTPSFSVSTPIAATPVAPSTPSFGVKNPYLTVAPQPAPSTIGRMPNLSDRELMELVSM